MVGGYPFSVCIEIYLKFTNYKVRGLYLSVEIFCTLKGSCGCGIIPVGQHVHLTGETKMKRPTSKKWEEEKLILSVMVFVTGFTISFLVLMGWI